MFQNMFEDMSIDRKTKITAICILACMTIAAYFIAGIMKGEININIFGGI